MAKTDDDDPQDDLQLRDHLKSTLSLMKSARWRAEIAVAALEAGTAGASKAMLAEHKELSTLVRMAIETEGKLNDWIAKHGTDDAQKPDVIDIHAARRDIGCRLDRLRACCRPE